MKSEGENEITCHIFTQFFCHIYQHIALAHTVRVSVLNEEVDDAINPHHLRSMKSNLFHLVEQK